MYKKFLLVGSGDFVDSIKGALTSLALEIEIANSCQEIQPKLNKKDIDLAIVDNDSLSDAIPILRRNKLDFVVVSAVKDSQAVLDMHSAGASDYIVKPYNIRELNLRLSAVLNSKKRIACLGGGAGLFNILMGLKNVPNVHLTSVVSTIDDGGSSGKLSASFGVLPPGDVRRSLAALCNTPQVMIEILAYRFIKGGDLSGHNLGNLILTALTKIKGSLPAAVRVLSDVLNIQGVVIPISETSSKLCALFEGGTIIKGESNIDLCKGRREELHIKNCWHEPDVEGDINAYSAIINSDILTIGPGDLFTSVITNLLIRNIRDAILKTKAKKVYICNLMTKPGETSNFDAYDHIKEVLKYLKKDCLDYVIIPDNSKLPKEIVAKYAKKRQFPVQIGDLKKIKKLTHAKIIVADLANKEELVHHDSGKIADQIMKIILRKKSR